MKKIQIQQAIVYDRFRIRLKFASKLEQLLRVVMSRDSVVNERSRRWSSLLRIVAQRRQHCFARGISILVVSAESQHAKLQLIGGFIRRELYCLCPFAVGLLGLLPRLRQE